MGENTGSQNPMIYLHVCFRKQQCWLSEIIRWFYFFISFITYFLTYCFAYLPIHLCIFLFLIQILFIYSFFHSLYCICIHTWVFFPFFSKPQHMSSLNFGPAIFNQGTGPQLYLGCGGDGPKTMKS